MFVVTLNVAMCRSYETEITKVSNTRLNYLVCLLCKSSKPIKN